MSRSVAKRRRGWTIQENFSTQRIATWQKSEESLTDRNMHIYVYAKQQDGGATDHFFEYLKHRRKRFGHQEEVVIETSEVHLLSALARLN